MNINQMRYFIKIAQTGNISSVAREEYISQSALSQQISSLEAEIGHSLMIRSNKGAKLTPIGKIVLKHFDTMLKAHANMNREVFDFVNDNKILKVSACPSMADYAVPCTLMTANNRFPNHKYELTASNSCDLYVDIENNMYDIGFAYYDKKLAEKYDKLTYVSCGRSEILLLAKNDDSIPDKITIPELLDMCLITLNPTSHITKSIMNALSESGYERTSLNCSFEVQSIESAKKIISKEFGMAFLPYISVKEELYKKKYKIIEVEDFKLDLDIVMISKKEHTPFVDEFIEWFSETGSNSFC